MDRDLSKGSHAAGDWDVTRAAALAAEHGVGELTEAHWRVLHALRALYREFGAAPSIVQLHQRTGLDAKAIDALFGNPYVAWRIAGLPHPGEEAETYLRNQ